MARVYLDSADAFTVSNNNVSVYGSTGTEVVTIASGVTGVTLDQNIEQVSLSGARSAYTYQQSGNQLWCIPAPRWYAGRHYRTTATAP